MDYIFFTDRVSHAVGRSLANLEMIRNSTVLFKDVLSETVRDKEYSSGDLGLITL